MTTIAALLVIAGFAWAIHRYAPRSSGRTPFRLEQFRPAAPLAGLFSDDADAERQYRDLAALQAHVADSESADRGDKSSDNRTGADRTGADRTGAELGRAA